MTACSVETHLARDDEHKGAAAVALNVRRRIAQVTDKVVQVGQARHQQLAAVRLHPRRRPAAVCIGTIVNAGTIYALSALEDVLRLSQAIAGRLP